MSIAFIRASRRAAVVCLVVAASLATVFVSRAAASTLSPERATKTSTRRIDASVKTALGSETRGHHASTPVNLHLSKDASLFAYAPPASAGARPMTVVYLHGVNGRAENGCPWFRSGASDLGWLVCPSAVERQENGTSSWGGDVFKQAAVVSHAVHAAEANGASAEPGVAIGFSQGGYVALDLVKTHLGHFRGLVLIAAPEAHPSAQKLHDAGVARVALAAGSLDVSYAALVEDTKRLRSEGMDARFFDLGRVGHTYAAEDTATLREAIAWAGGIQE